MELDTKNVASFQIDHTKLKCGLFVSRKDLVGSNVITTFDIRMKRPYYDEPMGTGSIHALEHLIATYMRSDSLWGDRIIYFGPMGCRTGFYLVVAGDLESQDLLPFIERTFDFVSDFEGEIPASNPKECGNCFDMDLEMAKVDATLYYNIIIAPKKENLVYPVKRERKKATPKDTPKE